MKLIKVDYKDGTIEIKECSDASFLQKDNLPVLFLKQLEVLESIDCESISFKHFHNNKFYRVTIKKNHTEYLFEIKLLGESPSNISDTDQMLKTIATKYLSNDENDLFELSDDPSKMLLFIYLEVRKLKVELESKNHSLHDRIQDNERILLERLEHWREELEDKIESDYLKKDEYTLWTLCSKSKKTDLILIMVVLILLAGVADLVDIRRTVKQLVDQPVELIK